MKYMIIVTEAALTKLLELRESPDEILHVLVSGGGCSGLSYKLEWHHKTVPFDEQITVGVALRLVTIATDSKSLLFIRGLTLDYSGGLSGTGFTFMNPNAKRTCGCGSSFGV